MAMTRPFFATLALAASACGVLGDDAPVLAPPTDGMSFGDASPIELCLGTARVVSPSVAESAAAACVRDGATAVPCAADEACQGIERCICGRCVVEVCDGSASCGAGLVCRGKRCTTQCKQGSDCGAGEQCVSGGCARSCTNDWQCHYGERCDALDQVCSVKTCSPSVPCSAGATCDPIATIGELHEPSLIDLGGATLAFIELRSGGATPTSAIYRARIDSPSRWRADPPEPVLGAVDAGRVGAPSVIARGDVLELYYVSGDASRIERATSKDGGASFVPEPSPVLAPSATWEAGRVGSPSVFDLGGATYLAYEGGAAAGIGFALVVAGAAQRLGTGPAITPSTLEDPVLWRGITSVGAPQVLVLGDVARIYVTGRGAELGDALAPGGPQPADRNDSIGLVTTRDLRTFDRFPTGPVYSRVTNLRSFLGEREAFVRVAPEPDITFVGTDASGANVSGLAHAGGR